MKTILVVEDDTDLRELIVTFLNARGYVARGAASSTEALDVLTTWSGTPCLVLLDMLMPGTGGSELLTRLEHTQRLASLPVVTMGAKDANMQDGIRTLSKPLSLDLLLRVVEEFCAAT